MGTQWYIGGSIVQVSGIIQHGYIQVKNGKIEKVGKGMPCDLLPEDKVIHLSDKWIVPGFVDVHVHGGNGASFMSGNEYHINKVAQFHATYGTTCMLATTATAPVEKLTKAIRDLSEYIRMNRVVGSRVVGIHVEGPFLSQKRKGAQDPRYIIDPSLELVDSWLCIAQGSIRLMTVAPELPGSLELIRKLHDFGVTVGAGHTDAQYDETLEAIRNGMTHSIHTFNGMRPLHHRDPGVLGAVLSDERVVCEVICDGFHVHPGAIRLLYKAKGAKGIILITDAVEVAGLPEGEYEWEGRPVHLQNGHVQLADGSSLAGSVLTMNQAYRNILEFLPVDMVEASLMASTNPANSIGLGHRKGQIAVGMDADLVVMNKNLEVEITIVEGEPVYTRSEVNQGPNLSSATLLF